MSQVLVYSGIWGIPGIGVFRDLGLQGIFGCPGIGGATGFGVSGIGGVPGFEMLQVLGCPLTLPPQGTPTGVPTPPS